MNREQEHNALREELSAFTPALDNVLAVAQVRAKKRKRIINCLVTPISGIVAVFIFFVATVNIFPTVAAAMEGVPGLRRLVAAVSFSPSLTEAVEHGFVQDMDLEQVINGVTMRIEHLILDGPQLHIFYSLESATNYQLGISLGITTYAEDGRGFPTLVGGTPHTDEDSLRHAMVWFDDDYEIPDAFIMSGNVLAIQPEGTWPGEVIGEYSFTLTLDNAMIAQTERITLDYGFILDGQSLTLNTVDINPAHTRFGFSADEQNSAWLRMLDFHMINENGERFEQPAVGAGIRNIRMSPDSMMMDVHFLESLFFAQSERLYMVIEEVSWLDKDMEFVQINLEARTSSPLPEGMRLVNVEQMETGWVLVFSTYEDGVPNMHRIIYTRHPSEWDDLENPTVFDGFEVRDMFRRIWSDCGFWFIYEDTPGLFFDVENPPVEGADGTIVSLTPQFSRTVRLDEPVVIRVK